MCVCLHGSSGAAPVASASPAAEAAAAARRAARDSMSQIAAARAKLAERRRQLEARVRGAAGGEPSASPAPETPASGALATHTTAQSLSPANQITIGAEDSMDQLAAAKDQLERRKRALEHGSEGGKGSPAAAPTEPAPPSPARAPPAPAARQAIGSPQEDFAPSSLRAKWKRTESDHLDHEAVLELGRQLLEQERSESRPGAAQGAQVGDSPGGAQAQRLVEGRRAAERDAAANRARAAALEDAAAHRDHAAALEVAELRAELAAARADAEEAREAREAQAARSVEREGAAERRLAALEARLQRALEVGAAAEASTAELEAAKSREMELVAARDELEDRLAGELARLRMELANAQSAAAAAEAKAAAGGDDERQAAYQNGLQKLQERLSDEVGRRTEAQLAAERARADMGDAAAARAAAEERARAAAQRAEELEQAMSTSFASSKDSHARHAELSAELEGAQRRLVELEGVRSERDEAVTAARGARRDLELARGQVSHLEVSLAAEKEASKSLLAIGSAGQEHTMVSGLREEVERLRESLTAATDKAGTTEAQLRTRDLAIKEREEMLAEAAAREHKLLAEAQEMESRLTQEEELQERAMVRLTAQLEAAELERNNLVSQLGLERADIAAALAQERQAVHELQRELATATHRADQTPLLEEHIESLRAELEALRHERVELQGKLYAEELARKQTSERLTEAREEKQTAEQTLVDRSAEQLGTVEQLQGQIQFLTGELEEARASAERKEHELEETIVEMRDDLREAQQVLYHATGDERSLAAAEKLRKRLALKRVDVRSEILSIADQLEDVQAELEDRAVRIVKEEELPRQYEAVSELREQVKELSDRLQKEEELHADTERRLGAVIVDVEGERDELAEQLSRERGAAASLSLAEGSIDELKKGLEKSEAALASLSTEHRANQEELIEQKRAAAKQLAERDDTIRQLKGELHTAEREAQRTGQLNGFSDRLVEMASAIKAKNEQMLTQERDDLEVRVAQQDAALLEKDEAHLRATEDLHVEVSRLEMEKRELLAEAAEAAASHDAESHAGTERLQSRIADLTQRLAAHEGDGDRAVSRLASADGDDDARQSDVKELVLPCLLRLRMMEGQGLLAEALVQRGRCRPFIKGEAKVIASLAADSGVLLVPDDVVVRSSEDGLTFFFLMQGAALAVSDTDVRLAIAGAPNGALAARAAAVMGSLRGTGWHLARVAISPDNPGPLTTPLRSKEREAPSLASAGPAPDGSVADGSMVALPAASIIAGNISWSEPHRKLLFGADSPEKVVAHAFGEACIITDAVDAPAAAAKPQAAPVTDAPQIVSSAAAPTVGVLSAVAAPAGASAPARARASSASDFSEGSSAALPDLAPPMAAIARASGEATPTMATARAATGLMAPAAFTQSADALSPLRAAAAHATHASHGTPSAHNVNESDLRARVEQLTSTMERLEREAAAADATLVHLTPPAEQVRLDDLFAEVVTAGGRDGGVSGVPASPHSMPGRSPLEAAEGTAAQAAGASAAAPPAVAGATASAAFGSPTAFMRGKEPDVRALAEEMVSETLQKRRLEELDAALERMRGGAPPPQPAFPGAPTAAAPALVASSAAHSTVAPTPMATLAGVAPSPAGLGASLPPPSRASAGAGLGAPIVAGPGGAESVIKQLSALKKEMANLPLEELDGNSGVGAVAVPLAAPPSGSAGRATLLPVVDQLLERLRK